MKHRTGITQLLAAIFAALLLGAGARGATQTGVFSFNVRMLGWSEGKLSPAAKENLSYQFRSGSGLINRSLNTISIAFTLPGNAGTIGLGLQSSSTTPLTTGTYNLTTNYPQQTASLSLRRSVYSLQSCKMVIRELTTDGGNAVQSFWATFIDYNAYTGVTALGDIRYNAGTGEPGGPIAVAGADQTVRWPGNVRLSGIVWDAAADGPVKVRTSWSGSPGVAFAKPALPETLATAGGTGDFIATLNASDAAGASSDSVTLHRVDTCTSLFLASGDWSRERLYTEADGPFDVFQNGDPGVANPGSVIIWNQAVAVTLFARSGQPLTTGTYAYAPFIQGFDGDTSPYTTGQFVIGEIAFDGSNHLTSLRATLSGSGTDSLGAPFSMRGEVRYNAMLDRPYVRREYAGLYSRASGRYGVAAMEVNSHGSFTGATYIRGVHRIFKSISFPGPGAWDGFTADGAGDVSVQLNEDGIVAGRIADSTGVSQFLLKQVTTTPGAQAGIYTLAMLPSDPATMAGLNWSYGIGILGADTHGRVRMLGVLPNRHIFTSGSVLDADQSLPFATEFATGESAGGWINFANLPGSDFTSESFWNVPQQGSGPQVTHLPIIGSHVAKGVILPGLNMDKKPNATLNIYGTDINGNIPLYLASRGSTSIGVHVALQWAGTEFLHGEFETGVFVEKIPIPAFFTAVFLQKANIAYGEWAVPPYLNTSTGSIQSAAFGPVTITLHP